MNLGIDLSKNKGITSCSEVMSVCSPLYGLLDVTYFNYVKIFPNGSRSVLTDRVDFITQYYSDPKLYTTNAVISMEKLQKTSMFMSCEFKDQLSYQVARRDFDIDNGLTIVHPSEEFLELYYFGTKKENYTHVEFYKSNIDLFYRFILYFKERASDLIEGADKDRFFLPGVVYDEQPSDLEKNIVFVRKSFLEATKPTKIVTKCSDESLVLLSYREAEVMYHLSKQLTAKQAAKCLNISYRTVESHVLKIKEKLGYKNKSDLLNYVNNSHLGQEIKYCFIEN